MKINFGLFAILLSLFSIHTRSASILDTTFNPGSGADGLVEQVLPLSNGKIMICGNFTSFNGQNKAYIARLNADGSVDTSFHAQPSYWVRNMSVQADGKIVIGGFFRQVQGISRSLIARLNADGSLDTSFNPGSGVTDVMYAGIDGNVDPFVFWTAIQPDGKILATGNFRNYNGASSWGLVRINPDGSRDTTFNVGGGLNSWGRHVLVQGNGQILVSGWFDAYRGFGSQRMVRINPDGSPDTSFTAFFGDRTAIYCSALLANGKMMVSGHSLNTNGLFRRAFARLHPNGTQDDSFVGYTNEKTESLAIQSDGKIIVGGYFSSVNGVRRTMVGRVHPEGQLDTSFSAEVDNFVWSVALQSDGKLLIGGGFNSVDGQSRRGIARLLTGAGGTPSPNPSPAPVLAAQAVSASQINLTWTDSATDRNGYTVERKTGAGGTYATVGTLAAAVRSWSDSGLSAGTSYFYRLRATTTSGGSAYSNEASATTQTAASPASATFVNLDDITSGTWKGVYGGEGYQVIADASSIPSYARVTPVNKSDWTWTWSTTDAAALQRPNNTDRLAACWYSFNTFSVDVSMVDGQSHQVAFYCLDWDNSGRRTLVQAVNPSTGAILDQRTISGFQRGQYLRYDVAGTVRFNFTPQAGNAVVSGIFFGAPQANPTPTVATPTISPNGGTFTSAQSVTIATATSGAEIRYTTNGAEPAATSSLYTSPIAVSSTTTVKAKAFKSGMNASATASATFTINTGGGGTGFYFAYSHTDTSAQGNWKGLYGADGYDVIGHSASHPTYANVSAIGKANWVWSQTTSDPRALQKPNATSGSDRIAACWYSGTSFMVDVNVSDTNIRRVALYFSDWDSGGRSQLVEVIDTSGAVIHSQTLSSFAGGKYLVYDLRGRVRFRVTKQTGPNAVVSGIFFSLSPRNF